MYLVVDFSKSIISIFASKAIVPLQHLQLLASQFLRVLSGNPTSPSEQFVEFGVNSRSAEAFPTLGNDGFVSFGELSVLNSHPQKLAGPGLLHELISPAHCDHEALDFMFADGEARKSYTYEQLDTLSTQFALRLLEYLPYGKTRRAVPVLLPQSPELYIALVGILKAGAAFVPLSLDAPIERIRFVVGDVRASVIVTESSFSNVFTWEKCPPTVLADSHVTAAPDELRLPLGIDPSGPAYIMYTSGSTGTPKGVIISHSAATQSLLAHEEHIPLFERFLQFAAPTFDVFVFEMFFPLFRGKTLVSCDRGRLLADLPGVINQLNIDGAELTPTVGRLLIERDRVPGLKVLLTIGEMLTRQVVDQFGGGVLQGMYGPTEAAIHCTLAIGFEKSWKIGDIGVPLKTVSAFILSTTTSDLEILPLGWTGELAVGGYQLADGYLNRPELTKEVFIDSKEYGRLYRTGDRARILSSGRIECLGRVGAGQVKLRGHRIELGEIEEVVLGIPGVRGAIASVLGGRLVVYVGGGVEREAVYDVCRKWLPEFMVPGDIVVLNELPRLSSGKADRKKLDMQYLETSQDYALESSSRADGQEWTVLEREVADVIAEVARVTPDEVGRGTSIFRLGLDSISVIQLSNRLTKIGYIRLDVSQIMRNPTASSIAHLLQASMSGPVLSKLVPSGGIEEFVADVEGSVLSQLGLSEAEVKMILPCTPLQEAMLNQSKDADLNLYYNHTTLSLSADSARLRDAWELMLKAHDIMRTCFCVTSHPRHAFAQVVLNDYQLPWSSFELEAGVDISEVINQRITLVSESLRTSKPPYAFSLLQTSRRATLIMHFHHSLYDEFAMNMLLDDVRRAYHGLGLPSRGTFESFLEYMEDLDLAKADGFWKATLEGLEPSLFPDLTGLTTASGSSLAGMGLVKIPCSRSLISVEGGCRSLQTSLLALGQTAWARLLSVYTGEIDVCFGNVVSGRTIPVEGVEDIIAPCFNTIPIRVQVSPDSTNRDVMNRLQLLNAELLPFQLTPLRRIMTTLRTQGQRLFDTLFILQHANWPSDLDQLWSEVGDRGNMDFSIVVELMPSRKTDTLEIALHFRG